MSVRQSRVLLILIGLACLVTMIPNLGCKESGGGSLPMSTLLTGPAVTSQVATTVGTGSYAVQGTVIAKSSGQVLNNISVSITYAGTSLGSTRTTAEGKFFFTGLPPALYDILVAVDSTIYGSSTYVIQVLSDGSTSPNTIEVPLTEKFTGSQEQRKFPVVGRLKVNDSTKAAVPYVEVRLIGSASQEIDATVSASDGGFEITSVSPGTYTLEAAYLSSSYKPRNLAIRISSEGKVVPYPEILLEAVTLEKKATIAGIVKLNTTGEPVSLVPVRLLGTNPVDKETTVDGKFYFPDLTSGFYKVDVDPLETRFMKQTIGIQVLADGTAAPELAQVIVTPKPVAVSTYSGSGTVTDAFTGGPLEYVTCNLTGINSFLTDRDGRFRFSDLVPGQYNLEFSKLGFSKLNVAFTIATSGAFFPPKLDYFMIYNPETSKGSIAGRYIDPLTGSAPVGDLWIQVYEYDFVTKSINGIDGNGNPYTVSETDWELAKDPAKYTEFRKASDAGFNKEGTFKFTHLDPAKLYLVYIGNTGSKITTQQVALQYPQYYPTLAWTRESPGINGNRKHSWDRVKVTANVTSFITNFEGDGR